MKYNTPQDYKISVNGGDDYVVSGSLVKNNGKLHLASSVNGYMSKCSVVTAEKEIFLFTEVRIVIMYIIILCMKFRSF